MFQESLRIAEATGIYLAGNGGGEIIIFFSKPKPIGYKHAWG
jgi:hypothetical protein